MHFWSIMYLDCAILVSQVSIAQFWFFRYHDCTILIPQVSWLCDFGLFGMPIVIISPFVTAIFNTKNLAAQGDLTQCEISLMIIVYVLCIKNDIVTNRPDCNNWDIYEPKLHNHNTWGQKSYNSDTIKTKIEQLEPGPKIAKLWYLMDQKCN